jgi:hypothetical protein
VVNTNLRNRVAGRHFERFQPIPGDGVSRRCLMILLVGIRLALRPGAAMAQLIGWKPYMHNPKLIHRCAA